MRSAALILCLVTSVYACGGNPTDGGEMSGTYSLRVISGDRQTGFQREDLADPVVVELSDGDGSPVSGVTLVTDTAAGSGVPTSTVTTDGSGRAQISWRLGDNWSQSASISVASDPAVSVTITANARYVYTTPASRSDGWVVGQARLHRPGASLLADAVEAIRRGTFTKIHSILIVRRDSLVLEAYFPGLTSNGTYVDFDVDTPHEVQSASKSFRAAMLGIAIDRGYISGVDETLFSFFPDFAHLNTNGKQDITIEHVLTMSTGIAWNEWSGTPNTLSQMYTLPAAEWLPFVLERPLQYEPGSTFVYNTGMSIGINQIILRGSGLNMARFVKDFYSDLVESPDVPGIGYPLPATVRPRDMAKLGQVYLRRGMWKDQRVISSDWVERSITTRFQVDASQGYGYQWWQRTFSTTQGDFDAFYASGNGGQFIIVVGELELVAVFTGGNFGTPLFQQPYQIMRDYVIPVIVAGG